MNSVYRSRRQSNADSCFCIRTVSRRTYMSEAYFNRFRADSNSPQQQNSILFDLHFSPTTRPVFFGIQLKSSFHQTQNSICLNSSFPPKQKLDYSTSSWNPVFTKHKPRGFRHPIEIQFSPNTKPDLLRTQVSPKTKPDLFVIQFKPSFHQTQNPPFFNSSNPIQQNLI